MSSLGSRHSGAGSGMGLGSISGSGGGPGQGGRPGGSPASGSGMDGGPGSGPVPGSGSGSGSGPEGPSSASYSSGPSVSSRDYLDHPKPRRKNYYSRDFQSANQTSLRHPFPHSYPAGSPPQFPAAQAVSHLPHYNYRNYLASNQSQSQFQAHAQSQSHNYLPTLALCYSYSLRQIPREPSQYQPRTRPHHPHHAGDSRLTASGYSGYSQKPYRSFSADDNHDDSKWRSQQFRKGSRFRQSSKDYFKPSYPDSDRYADHSSNYGDRTANGDYDRSRNQNGEYDRSRTQNGDYDRSRIRNGDYEKLKSYNGDYDRHKPYKGFDRKLSYGSRSTSYSDESVIRHQDQSNVSNSHSQGIASFPAPTQTDLSNHDSSSHLPPHDSSRDINHTDGAEILTESNSQPVVNDVNIAQEEDSLFKNELMTDVNPDLNPHKSLHPESNHDTEHEVCESNETKPHDDEVSQKPHRDQYRSNKFDDILTNRTCPVPELPAPETPTPPAGQNPAKVKAEPKVALTSKDSVIPQASTEKLDTTSSVSPQLPATSIQQELDGLVECSFPLNRLDDMYHQLVKDYASESPLAVLPFLASEPVCDFKLYPFYAQNLRLWSKLKILVKSSAETKRTVIKKHRAQLWNKYKTLNLISERKRKDMEQQLRVIYDGNDEKRRELDLVNQRSTPGPSAAPNTPGVGNAPNSNDAVAPLSRSRRHGDSVTTEAEFQEILASLERQQRLELGPLAQAQAVAAEIPAMELDPAKIKHVFYDANNIVRDKVKWALRIQEDFIDDWSPLEHERFTEAFLAMPKRFGAISRALDGVRSPEQCVIHYYATKKASNYKVKLLSVKKKPGRKPGRKRGRRPNSAGSASADAEAGDLQPENEAPPNPIATDAEETESHSLKRARSPSPLPLPAEASSDATLEEQSAIDDPRRKTCSSYWKFHEVAQFPLLLEAFGTRWTLIADELHTKTANMVRNYYSRNANKNGWIELAQYADQRYRENTFDRLNAETESEAEQTQELEVRDPSSQTLPGAVSVSAAQNPSFDPSKSNPVPLPRHYQLISSILNLDVPLPVSQSPTADATSPPVPQLFSLPSASNQLNKLLN